ncbi:hypothetical protein [Micromonospora sp. KC207]|nr:hypothetical protein [Micromonospora sp. KC207]
MYVQTPEFARVAKRMHQVADLTSRLNVLPFGDAELPVSRCMRA